MNEHQQHTNPLEYILRCAEQGLVPELFSVNNAKDELKQLRKELEYYKNIVPLAWAKMNNRGDIYDLRLQNNPYETILLPLYANREEFKTLLNKLKNP